MKYVSFLPKHELFTLGKESSPRNPLDETHKNLITVLCTLTDEHENCKVLRRSFVSTAKVFNVVVSRYRHCK